MNIEGSFQHLLTDLYAFIATAIAGVVILATGFDRADAVAALLVAALMLRAAVGLLRDSGRVLLEIAPPSGVDVDEVGRAMAAPPARDRGARPARLGDRLAASRRSRRTCSSSPTPTATRLRRELERCSASASRSTTRRSRSTTRRPTACSRSATGTSVSGAPAQAGHSPAPAFGAIASCQ